MKSFILFCLLFLLISCGESVDNATGWPVGDQDFGGFNSNMDYDGQQAGPGLVFIQGGTFDKGRVIDDFMKDFNNEPVRVYVPSFYIDETEVTNLMYRHYLHWLRRVMPPDDERYKNIYNSALPDTLVWRDVLRDNEVYSENYLRHPAYNDYPVVGVSWIQAKFFCEWRTDRVNEKILIDNGIIKNVNGSQDKLIYGENNFNTKLYLKSPDLVFGSNSSDIYDQGLPDYSPDSESDASFEGRHVQIEDGLLLPNYRLPTESEWEYAAMGLSSNSEYNSIKGKKIYPWEGKYPRPTDPSDRGNLLANFKRSYGDYGGVLGWPNDGYGITSPVKEFPPNDFGLYGMAGNVSEWVADVYRNVNDHDIEDDFKYFRGNVFKKIKLDPEGNPLQVEENIEYDTASNGKLIPKRLPGSIVDMDVEDKDNYMRQNYIKADNVNVKDGDIMSSRYYSSSGSEENQKYKMYNSPRNKFKEEKGDIVVVYDKKTRTSLVNDKSRVYKGGSWKDRVYWLSPSQRRFLDQYLSSSSIGFRCAMDHLGGKN